LLPVVPTSDFNVIVLAAVVGTSKTADDDWSIHMARGEHTHNGWSWL